LSGSITHLDLATPTFLQYLLIGHSLHLGLNSSQFKLGLIRRLCQDKPEPVRDSVHMRIHSDSGFAKPEGDHDVRSLPANSLKLQKIVDLVRNL
jgi:hypothetical protein